MKKGKVTLTKVSRIPSTLERHKGYAIKMITFKGERYYIVWGHGKRFATIYGARSYAERLAKEAKKAK